MIRVRTETLEIDQDIPGTWLRETAAQTGASVNGLGTFIKHTASTTLWRLLRSTAVTSRGGVALFRHAGSY